MSLQILNLGIYEDFYDAFLTEPEADEPLPKHLLGPFRFHMEASPRKMYYIDQGKAQFTVATFDWEQPEGTPVSLHLYQHPTDDYKVKGLHENLKRLANKRGIGIIIGS